MSTLLPEMFPSDLSFRHRKIIVTFPTEDIQLKDLFHIGRLIFAGSNGPGYSAVRYVAEGPYLNHEERKFVFERLFKVTDSADGPPTCTWPESLSADAIAIFACLVGLQVDFDFVSTSLKVEGYHNHDIGISLYSASSELIESLQWIRGFKRVE